MDFGFWRQSKINGLSEVTIMVSQKIILVVEDNEINRAMLCAILEPEYKVLEAENGLER